MDDEISSQGGSHASSSHEVSLEPTFKRREDLGKHNVYTHFPKDRNCEICQRTKITRAPCRRRNGEAVPRAVNFGDLITADHKVLSDNCESRNNHRYAVVVQDLATQWIQAYPCKTETSQETQRSLQKFLEPHRTPKVIYNHSSLKFGKACEDLSWNHSLHVCTTLRNVTDLSSNGKTPCGRRFGQQFKGPIVPFGSLVEYHPVTAKDQSGIHQFGRKVLIVLRIRIVRGGIWKGDVLVAEFEELETMDASKVMFPQEKRRIYFFQSQMDESNLLG